ncbi:hypothetical protein [Bacillus sp. JCM 19041]|uniref:hypothetical protein n=1 Tax=Bacillus sp. JCM 19041 TaxID=1460637 RepID=UPI0006D17C8A
MIEQQILPEGMVDIKIPEMTYLVARHEEGTSKKHTQRSLNGFRRMGTLLIKKAMFLIMTTCRLNMKRIVKTLVLPTLIYIPIVHTEDD